MNSGRSVAESVKPRGIPERLKYTESSCSWFENTDHPKRWRLANRNPGESWSVAQFVKIGFLPVEAVVIQNRQANVGICEVILSKIPVLKNNVQLSDPCGWRTGRAPRQKQIFTLSRDKRALGAFPTHWEVCVYQITVNQRNQELTVKHLFKGNGKTQKVASSYAFEFGGGEA